MTLSSRIRKLAALAFVLAVPAANAQLFRAYLAVEGSDANPCTLPAPCRLLPAALNAVQSGGEVWMLDSANYNTGTVTVTKSVTILAVPGTLGSLVSASGSALAINGAGIDVTLQNLNIRNSGSGDAGIHVLNAASVVVKDCHIFGFNTLATHAGIWMNTPSTPARLTVTGTTIRNNGRGIAVNRGRVTLAHSTLVGNTAGVWSTTSGTNANMVHVGDTVAIGNGTAFVVLGAGGPYVSYLIATRVTATENTIAFSTEGNSLATVEVGDSVVTGNGTGFNNTTGATGNFLTRGNNRVEYNVNGNVSGGLASAGGNI